MSNEKLWSKDAEAIINMKVDSSTEEPKSGDLRDFGTGATRSKDADAE